MTGKSVFLGFVRNFKVHILGITLLIVAGVFIVSSLITYQVFVSIWKEQDRISTIDQFRHTEESINWLLDNTGSVISKLMLEQTVQDFMTKAPSTPLEKALLDIDLMLTLNKSLATNNDINALIVLREDGHMGGSSLQRSYFQNVPAHPFFNTPEYRRALEVPSIVWGSAYLRTFFSQSTLSSYSAGDILVVGLKAVQYRQTQKYVIIASVKEQSLRRIINLMSDDQSTIALLDADGRQIAGPNLDVQRVQPFFHYIGSEDFGSLQLTDEDRQIIYYRLKRTGWVLVKTVPIAAYTKTAAQMRMYMLFIGGAALLLISVAYSIWVIRFTRPFDQLIIQNQKAKDEILQLEIKNLQSQINPHFIYNTITSIRFMATFSGAHTVADALVLLIKLLRPVFSTPGNWTFENELAFANHYIELMKIRYGGDIVFEAPLPNSIMCVPCPRFILQPLLENCVEHARTGQMLTLSLGFAEDHPFCMIYVDDDGSGIPEEKIEELNRRFERNEAVSGSESEGHTGIAMQNVNRRLKLHYGDACGLHIEKRQPSGTRVIVKLKAIKS